MNFIKIMHFADYHIGYEYSFLGNASENRKIEVLKSLEKLCQFSNQNNIDIILIAGDFIEASTITRTYIKEVKDILSKVESKIFLVAGNHDYISLGSYYLDDDWPDNTYIFKSGKVEKIELKSLNTCIYGASFTSTYQRHGFLQEDFEIDSSKINIGIFHGDALFQKDYLYNPISKKDIEKSGFDYMGLGHIHKKTKILSVNKTDYAYPGSAVSLGFGEEGEKGVIIAEISKDSRRYDFYKLDIGQFIGIDIEVSDDDKERELSKKIMDIITKKYPNPLMNYYKINLIGYVEEGFCLDLNLLHSMLSEIVYVRIIDQTRIKLNFEALQAESSLRGVFIKNILIKQEEARMKYDQGEIEILQEALDITLKAFEGN